MSDPGPVIAARAPGPLIPARALIAGTGVGARVGASASARAIAAGLLAAGRAEPDICPLQEAAGAGQLAAAGFDARMHVARALVIVSREMRPHRLRESLAFELATRARQGGVPAFAVTGEDGLDAFDARILDLQLVIEARSPAALRAAGERLARMI